MTIDSTSIPPGTPIRKMRRIKSRSGRSLAQWMRKPALPHSSTQNGISPPIAWPQAVLMPSASQPIAGRGPSPSSSDQATVTLTTLTTIIATSPVTMSPAPRKQPMPTASSIIMGNIGTSNAQVARGQFGRLAFELQQADKAADEQQSAAGEHSRHQRPSRYDWATTRLAIGQSRAPTKRAVMATAPIETKLNRFVNIHST